MRTKKQLIACGLSIALLLGMIPTSEVSAAKKVALSTKKLTIQVGQSKKLNLKNNKKKVKWTVTSGKKNITLTSKKKTEVTVVGKKKGTAKLQAKVGKKKYTCKVTVKAKAKATPKPTTQPTGTPTATASAKPIGTPTTETPEPGEILTLYYNDGNAEQVKKQIAGSNIPVHVIVEDSVTGIGDYAFVDYDEAYDYDEDCDRLTSITIPDSVTNIGSNAFFGCHRLTNITVAEGNGTYDSRNNCNSIIETDTNTLIKGCKNTTIPDSVTSIGSSAFYTCSSLLTSITIPDSVTSIGSSAFFDCRGLTSIAIPYSVTSIGSNAFFGCSGLTSITIPDGVTSIGERAFAACSGLTSIMIPNSVTSIGSIAFLGCSGLTSITWNGKTYTDVNDFSTAFENSKE